MTTYSVLPAELNLELVAGDEFAMLLDFSISLSSYSWEAIVFESGRAVSSTFPAGINTQGDTAATFTVTEVDAPAGQLNLSLDETQTAALDEATAYRWLLRGIAPGAITRTYISGQCTVRTP